jgi:hypothetical protein
VGHSEGKSKVGDQDAQGLMRTVGELLGYSSPCVTARSAHVVDMTKENPALSIPVKPGIKVMIGTRHADLQSARIAVVYWGRR